MVPSSSPAITAQPGSFMCVHLAENRHSSERTKNSLKLCATSIGVRFSGISYSKIKTSYTAGQLNDFHLDDLGGRAKWFFEPATVSSFGFKNVPGLRFEVQGGLSFLMARNYIDYRKFNFSIGAGIDFGSIFNKNRQ